MNVCEARKKVASMENGLVGMGGEAQGGAN